MAPNDLIALRVEFTEREVEILEEVADGRPPAEWLREMALMVIAAQRNEADDPEDNGEIGRDASDGNASQEIPEFPIAIGVEANLLEYVQQLERNQHEMLAWLKVNLTELFRQQEFVDLLAETKTSWRNANRSDLREPSEKRARRRFKDVERAVRDWVAAKKKPEDSHH